MKKIIFTLFLAAFSLIAFGQSIIINDATNNCIAGLADVTLAENGLFNTKKAYTNGTYTMTWNSTLTQWEVHDNSGMTPVLLYTSPFVGSNNQPPCGDGAPIWIAEGGCGSLKVTGGCSGTLPVELSAFTATAKANIVTLDWATASELDNEGFEIQYSKNGTEWEILKFIEGMGTTYETTRYDYTHEVTNSGTHFYRLMQEDFDGTTSYSDIVSVKVKANLVTGVMVVPNYVINDFRLTTTNEEGIYDVQIFDTNGRLMRSITNITANTSIDASDLMSGIYFVRINDGNHFITKRIIKF